MPSSSSSSKLPLKSIPGDYGLPFFGPIKDRLDYFYFQGQDKFFQDRTDRHKSTIFRTNMPSGPFIASNAKVIALLDAVSFPALFDMSKVEKRNVLRGTFLPTLSHTGGYRVCAYLDPSESKHSSLKSWFLSTIASKHEKFIPLFRTCLLELFTELQDEMSEKVKRISIPSVMPWLSTSFSGIYAMMKTPMVPRLDQKVENLFSNEK